MAARVLHEEEGQQVIELSSSYSNCYSGIIGRQSLASFRSYDGVVSLACVNTTYATGERGEQVFTEIQLTRDEMQTLMEAYHAFCSELVVPQWPDLDDHPF